MRHRAEHLEATLVMLKGREGQGRDVPVAYRPPVFDPWRVQDAIAWVRRLLGKDGCAAAAGAFLPAILVDAPARDLCCRAAVASTFVAGLELQREESLTMHQELPFTAILFEEPVY